MMQTQLNPKELAFCKENNVPLITFGDLKKDHKSGKMVAKETVITNVNETESAQILDYIFKIDNADPKSADVEGRLRVKPKSMEVERFAVDDLIKEGKLKELDVNGKARKYEWLSDHYGLSLVV